MKLIVLLAAWIAATAALPSSRFNIIRDVGSVPKLTRFSTTAPNPFDQNTILDEPLAEQSKSKQIPIILYSHDWDNDGEFVLGTVSGDESTLKQEGHLVDLGDKKGPVQVTSGSFSFIGDDGKSYTTKFIGFQTEGTHLPTPPPISDEIRDESIMAAIMEHDLI